MVQVSPMDVEQHWVHVVYIDGYLNGGRSKGEMYGVLVDLTISNLYAKDLIYMFLSVPSMKIFLL